MQLGPCVLRWATIPSLTGSFSVMMTNNNKGGLFFTGLSFLEPFDKNIS